MQRGTAWKYQPAQMGSGAKVKEWAVLGHGAQKQTQAATGVEEGAERGRGKTHGAAGTARKSQRAGAQYEVMVAAQENWGGRWKKRASGRGQLNKLR